MFDSILTHPQAPRGTGPGLALALLISGMACGLALFLFKSSRVESLRDVDVTLVTARATNASPPPPPPPPAGGGGGSKVQRKAPTRRRELILRPKADPDPKPSQEEIPPEPARTAPEGEAGGVVGGVVGGVPGGVVGGVRGGVVGGVVGGTGNSILPFGAGMTRPQQISGGAPQYSREALAARVEGKVMIRCTITAQGEVVDCKVIRSVPMLDDVALASLRQSRYTPVTLQGRAESVQYLFTFNFKLP